MKIAVPVVDQVFDTGLSTLLGLRVRPEGLGLRVLGLRVKSPKSHFTQSPADS